jgi:hypothetical protein
VTLESPWAFQPSKKVKLSLAHPADAEPPDVRIHFVAIEQMPAFLLGRDEGALPYPEDLSPFHQIRPHANDAGGGPAGASAKRTLGLSFESAAKEGLYLVIVASPEGSGGAPVRFHVVIANRHASVFPRPGYDDLSDVLVPYVNASNKNGILWFMQPAWFAEHMLNITLTPAFLAELAMPANRLPWDPLEHAKFEHLQQGRELGGVQRIWLVADAVGAPDSDDDSAPCFDYSAMRETPPEPTRA